MENENKRNSVKEAYVMDVRNTGGFAQWTTFNGQKFLDGHFLKYREKT